MITAAPVRPIAPRMRGRQEIVLKFPIYLDYHATTPVDERVVAEMLPYFTEGFGNPSSRNHAFGWKADKAVDQARRHVANLVGASSKEVVFTSGATESNNLAIKGALATAPLDRKRVVTVCTEHHAVLDTCRRAAAQGFEVTVLPVGRDGLVDLDRARDVIDARTVLVSVMAANNEIGVLQPLRTLAELAHRHGALFHTDAAQIAGRVPFSITEVDADLVSLTAHKFYGPKGAGALIVRRRTPRLAISPLFDGGGQEQGLRPGTLNVPGIVGLGAAAALCSSELGSEPARIGALRDRLLHTLMAEVGEVTVNGSLTARLPHNLNVTFAAVDGAELHMALDDVAVSSGAACATASSTPSHVLSALGVGDEAARATIRFGLGRWTSTEEVDYAVQKTAAVVSQLRARRAAMSR